MARAGKLPLLFNGYDLTTYCKVNYSWAVMSDSEVYMYEAQGRTGGIYLGHRLKPRVIPVMLKLDVQTIAEMNEAIDWLGTVLNVTSPVAIVFPHQPNRTYYGMWSGGTSLDNLRQTGKLEGEIVCPYPFGYGVAKTITVPSGGSVTLQVGGQVPASYGFSVTATRGTSNLWSLQLDSKDYIRYVVPTASGTKITLSEKLGGYVSTVANNSAIPTLDSNYFVLSPGSHLLKNDIGTGATTFTYTERWL